MKEDVTGYFCTMDETAQDLTYKDMYMERPEWCPMHEVRKPDKDADEFTKAFNAGFDYGYQMGIKDVIKKAREMKWYGGDKQAQRTD
jgi:hypothetical protein